MAVNEILIETSALLYIFKFQQITTLGGKLNILLWCHSRQWQKYRPYFTKTWKIHLLYPEISPGSEGTHTPSPVHPLPPNQAFWICLCIRPEFQQICAID